MSDGMTPREQQVYNVLTADEWLSAGTIAYRAEIRTMNTGETAAKFCNKLTKKGLVMKGGTRMFPLWCRPAIARGLAGDDRGRE